MTAPIDSVVVLSRALDQTADVLDAIHPDQLGLPTPCSEWTVERLIGHVVQDPRNLLAMARGEDVDWSAEPGPIQVGHAEDFREAADDLIHHWHQQGDQADPASVDMQTAEFAVHAWDLHRATGQQRDLDEGVAEHALVFLQGALKPEMRGDAFKPEVPAPDGATAYERLAAFAGRDPR
jgi:uncharacterized protein (TIGR03086 family)